MAYDGGLAAWAKEKRMRIATRIAVMVGALLIGTGAFAQPSSKGKAEPMSFSFGDVRYMHRWSKNGQNEFTPVAQADLRIWQDMVTVNLFENVKTGEALSEIANRIVGNYATNGKILRTDSIPRTKDRPAEYLIVAVMGRPDFLEAAFTRLVLRDGAGYAIVRSHRIYGKEVGDPMSAWLQKSGPTVETTLMKWEGIPAKAALKQLPQAK
jgi:hypothetical protein